MEAFDADELGLDPEDDDKSLQPGDESLDDVCDRCGELVEDCICDEEEE